MGWQARAGWQAELRDGGQELEYLSTSHAGYLI